MRRFAVVALIVIAGEFVVLGSITRRDGDRTEPQPGPPDVPGPGDVIRMQLSPDPNLDYILAGIDENGDIVTIQTPAAD